MKSLINGLFTRCGHCIQKPWGIVRFPGASNSTKELKGGNGNQNPIVESHAVGHLE